MGMYTSLIGDELDFPALQQYEQIPHSGSHVGHQRLMVPLWVELATLMVFVMGAILWGARSRSNREIPE